MTTTTFAKSAAERAWLGTTQRVPLRDTAGTVRTADLLVTDAVHLGCGCYRLYADRPGPRLGQPGYAGISAEVQLLTGACGLHCDERERCYCGQPAVGSECAGCNNDIENELSRLTDI